MKQARLGFRSEKKSLLTAKDQADQQNLIAARVIMGDPERYAGAQLLWAQMFMERYEREQAASNRNLDGNDSRRLG